MSGSDACWVSVCELCGGFERSVRAYVITYVCDICAYLDQYFNVSSVCACVCA